MSDQTLKTELKRLLSDVDLAREQEQLSKRQRSIDERTLWRATASSGKPILPAMRLLMFELESAVTSGSWIARATASCDSRSGRGQEGRACNHRGGASLDQYPRLRLSVHHEFRVLHSVEAPLGGLDDRTRAAPDQ